MITFLFLDQYYRRRYFTNDYTIGEKFCRFIGGFVMDIRKIAVLGSGRLGRGIAETAASSGF